MTKIKISSLELMKKKGINVVDTTLILTDNEENTQLIANSSLELIKKEKKNEK